MLPAGRTRTLDDIVATHKPVMYNSTANRAVADLGADVPWITSEELILLRAEIRCQQGTR